MPHHVDTVIDNALAWEIISDDSPAPRVCVENEKVWENRCEFGNTSIHGKRNVVTNSPRSCAAREVTCLRETVLAWIEPLLNLLSRMPAL